MEVAERVADEIGEIIVLQAVFQAENVDRIDQDRKSQRNHLFPEGIEGRIVQVSPGHIGADLHAEVPEGCGVVQLLCRCLRILERGRCHAGEPLRIGPGKPGKAFV